MSSEYLASKNFAQAHVRLAVFCFIYIIEDTRTRNSTTDILYKAWYLFIHISNTTNRISNNVNVYNW